MKTNIFLIIGISLALAFIFSCGEVEGNLDGGDSSSSGSNNDISNYRTVEIGNQTWMAENLNYEVAGSKCYNNDPNNCAKYGRLYNWATALTVCPSGWHLPNDDEWNELIATVGHYENLRASTDWQRVGENEHGFSGLPAGIGLSDGSFSDIGVLTRWWSATQDEQQAPIANCRHLTESTGGYCLYYKTQLFSVRCVK